MFSIILFIRFIKDFIKTAHDSITKKELKNAILVEARSLKEADFIDSRQYEHFQRTNNS
jgi:hypothetical protein